LSLPAVCLRQVVVGSLTEAQDLLRRAARARQSGGTAVNERSSRSHAVITVKLQAGGSGSGGADSAAALSSEQQARPCVLHFVDLAGCERVKRTGNSGARLR
jgi:hypothetical protein